MRRLLKTRLERAFALTADLVEHLEEEALGADLPDLPSNRMSGQLWCVVGARESYAAAIEAGAWQGFSCSLKRPGASPRSHSNSYQTGRLSLGSTCWSTKSNITVS